MAQTPRKRRSKHRGNAAGVIESRGRTGRPPTPDERKRQVREQARERRLNTPPTWQSSLKRSALAAGIMLVVLVVIEKGTAAHKVEGAVLVAALAVAIYTPAAYYLESWMYRRRMTKQGTTPKR
jgi:hypothetical protein